MIVNKKSALMGFGLILYAVITIIALVACITATGAAFTVAGVLNTLCNGWIIAALYNDYSNNKD